MLDSILGFFGLVKRKELKTTVRLEVIQKQIEEFNESKRQINDKIGTLENKTDVLGSEVSKTLDMTKENQARLNSIEDNLQRIIALTERMMPAKQADGVKKGADGAPQ
ncbi:MAG: hypothetical protein V1875_09255 [Candidatus Altiarchaeota archaeon]